MKQIIIYLFLVAFVISCKKKTVEVKVYSESDRWGFESPSYFPSPDYQFANNEQTRLRFELGRYLFYDTLLSSDQSVSCSSCHAQAHAFADHNVKFSKGVGGVLGHRNAPALSNLAWYPNFMWDGGVNHIEVQPLVPLTSPLEMNETMSNIVYKLNASSFYKEKFKSAYGIDEITDQKFLQALTQFTSMLISSNTKYDQYLTGTTAFTEQEGRGLGLFRNSCAHCHKEPLLTDFSYRNSGLESTIVDIGRELITQDPNDKGKFKVPTLRNIDLTYPYMHDGRFFTLTQVVDFYSDGIQQSSTIDPTLGDGFHFTSQEKLDLIAFLKTLTDYYLIGNPDFSEPKR